MGKQFGSQNGYLITFLDAYMYPENDMEPTEPVSTTMKNLKYCSKRHFAEIRIYFDLLRTDLDIVERKVNLAS
jgi:hypothetical protein